MADNPFLAPTSRPLVVGHRGVPRLAQENTREGLRRAVELGVPAVEVDLTITRDDVVVLFHDFDTERLTGVAGTVVDRTWDELSRLRIGRRVYMGEDVDGRPIVLEYEREQPIARLDEVLDEFGGSLAFELELKPPVPAWSQRHIGAHVARAVRDAGLVDSVIVTSFDLFKLVSLEQAGAGIHSGFAYDVEMRMLLAQWACELPELSRLTGDEDPAALLDALLEVNAAGRFMDASVLSAEHSLLDRGSVDQVRARGLSGVGAFTLLPIDVRSARTPPRSEPEAWAEVDRLVELGVEWIETDEPEPMLEHLARRP